ncbi:MAG TPA: hypothetical protein VGB30_07770 [bacterium]
MPCKNCGEAVNYVAIACEHCGVAHPTERSSDANTIAPQFLAASIVAGYILIKFNLHTLALVALILGPAISVGWFILHREYSRRARATAFTMKLKSESGDDSPILPEYYANDPYVRGDVHTMFDPIKIPQIDPNLEVIEKFAQHSENHEKLVNMNAREGKNRNQSIGNKKRSDQ